MSKIGAEIELFLEKKFSEFRDEAKSDRHEQNNYIQKIIVSQEDKIEKALQEGRGREEKILSKISSMYSRKWVERLMFSAGSVVIFGVAAIIWNVFQDKITIILEGFLK